MIPAALGAAAPDKPAVRFALVAGDWINMPAGTYAPPRGWISPEDGFKPFQPGDAIMLFDMGGKAGESAVIEPRRPDPDIVPIAWTARIRKWVPTALGDGYALALRSPWPAPRESAQAVPLDNPEALALVRQALKEKKLKVEHPRLTHAIRLSDPQAAAAGDSELLVCATSDNKALTDASAAARYSLCLLQMRHGRKDKTYILASQTSFKLASRSLDNHNHLYGYPDYDHPVAFVDLDGDGRSEIVLCLTHVDGMTSEVFSWKNDAPQKVLSVYRSHDLY